MTVRRSLVVVVHDDAGHIGYGESPPFELPFYSEETVDSARLLLEQVLIPRLAGREIARARGGGRAAAARRSRQPVRPRARSRPRPCGTSRRIAAA